MKNLRDYFPSPKSYSNLNESVSKLDSCTDELPQRTRKLKRTLSNVKSKRKKLPTNTEDAAPLDTVSKSIVIDESDDYDAYETPKKNKRKKSNAESCSSTALSLKKRKGIRAVSRETALISYRKQSDLLDRNTKEIRKTSLSVDSGPEPVNSLCFELERTNSIETVAVDLEHDSINNDGEKRLISSTGFEMDCCTSIRTSVDECNGVSLNNNKCSEIIALSDQSNDQSNDETLSVKKKRKVKCNCNDSDDGSNSKKKSKTSMPQNLPVHSHYKLESETVQPETTASQGRKSLLNYFSKVDRTAVSKTNQVCTIKVEAIVHEPKEKNKSKRKLNISNKTWKSKAPDFDLITSEEDCCIVDDSFVENKNQPWKIKINFHSQTVCQDDSVADDCMLVNSSSCFEDDIDMDAAVAVNENSVDGVKAIEISKKSITPRLKEAGSLAAYFGLKSEEKKSDQGDRERSLATQMFLQSSVPATLKKMVGQQNSEAVEGSDARYPVHNHVRQKDRLNIMWNLPLNKLNLKSDIDRIPPVPVFSPLCYLEELLAPKLAHVESATSQVKTGIKLLKEQGCDVPIKRWLENLRAMKKSSSVSEMWNEKYRPKTTDDVILEKSNVEKLSNWLNTFQSNMSDDGSDSDSSGDEFVDGKNNKYEKVCKFGNTALLTGPSGVGKTAAVFAAAKQNGYQVLELNASCIRNGKKVLHEFLEATQSHKVETKSLFKSKCKKKNKGKRSNNKSLILIEDSDLLFNDMDEGYVASLSLLQSGSKRPLILVANDSDCKHLVKLAPPKSTLSLSFQRPDPHVFGCYLKSVSLVEGTVLSQESLDFLLQLTDCDLRKAVINLQFYGSLDRQLDRRKLRMRSNSLSILAGSTWKSKEESKKNMKRSTTICIADLLSHSQNYGRDCWIRQSTSLSPREEDESVNTLSDDLSHLLIMSLNSDHHPLVSNWESGIYSRLSEVVDVSHSLSRRAITCDYYSALRVIARSERTRLQTHTKRNKRYFNHFNNLGINISDQHFLNTLCLGFGADN